MIGILSGILLVAVALTALMLQRLYSIIPARELKRLARRNDQLAKTLYRPVAYGQAMRLFLWLVTGAAFSAGLLLLLPHMPVIAGFLLMALLLMIGFVLIPSLRLTVRSAQFAASLSPSVVWVLSHVHKPLDRVAVLINDYRDLMPHSRIYEKEDLSGLLTLQKDQADNRITEADIELIQRALSFGDKQVADIVQPRRDAHLVNADDTLGPVLMDQLHKSKQSSFLVYKDSKDNILGSLLMKDAVAAKQGGRVFDLVHHDLIFMNEDFTLRQALTAFQQTGQQVAVVINAFEEFLGVVTLSALLQELAGEGEAPVDNYEDRSVVAGYKPTKDEDQAETADTQENENETAEAASVEEGDVADTSPEATEVVK